MTVKRAEGKVIIMSIENFAEVQTYLDSKKEDAEVKTYLDSFKVQPSLEVFKNKLNDADFKSFMDSEKDNHYKKAHATWETNNLQKLVDQKVKELYPEADPKDLEVKQLKIMIEQMQKDKIHEELVNLALKTANEKKLPVELVDLLIGSDKDSTIKNFESLERVFAPLIDAQVTERMKSSSYVPPKGDDKTGEKNPWSLEYFNLTEQGRILSENPELAKTLMSVNK